MNKALQKLTAMGLTAVMTASMTGFTALAEGNSSANFEWVSEAQPDGWTEADATETANIHLSAAAYQLDPYAAAGGDAGAIMQYLIFDNLLTRDPATGEYTPWLAESWELAEDGSTMSFVLREDAYFTNGEQVTADDCVFSIERVVTDTEHLPDSSAKPFRNYVDNVEKTGEFSFTIHFKQPNPEIIYLLSGFGIMSKKAYEEMGYDAYWSAPVGSGPFVIDNFDSANGNASFTIRSDEHGYWGYDYVNSYTNLKHVNITYAPEATTRLSSLRAGEADIINDVPTIDAPALEAEGFTIDVLPAVTYIFLQFACADGDVFANRDLREAMSLCIDREAIVAALLGGYGYPAKTNASENDLGYQEEITYEYNVEKAKELVAASGYNGEPIKFIYTTSTVSIATELAQAIQSMAAEVGINLEVTPLEVAIYDEARETHSYDVCIGSIIKSGNMWFKTATEVIGTDRFNTGLTNIELMEIGLEVGKTMDQAELDRLLQEMAKIELTEFEPNIYLYFPTLMYAQNPKLIDVNFHAEHKSDLKFAKLK